MKTKDIKQETIDKCLIVLRKLKYRADNALPMNIKTIYNKVHTNRAIPSAAKSLNYFRQESVNKWVCLKTRFDPKDARDVLEFIYGNYKSIKKKIKSNTKNQFKDLFPLHQSVKEPEDKMRIDFIPPTIKEVENYCISRKNDIDPQGFHEYYHSRNWCDSKGGKVKSWKGRVVTWERNQKRTVFMKGEINGYSNEEISKEFKKRGLSEKLNEYSDDELIDELKKRGYTGGIKKDISL